MSLIPPDTGRCQAEKPNGNSFMTLGGSPGLERCRNIPLWIAREIKPGPDGQIGSMSLCRECRTVLERQMPDYATFEPIEGGPT